MTAWVPSRRASRSIWATGLRYVLLFVLSVLGFNTVSAFLAVYFRRRPPAAVWSSNGAVPSDSRRTIRAISIPPGLGNYLLVWVSRHRDRFIAGRRFFPLWGLVHHRGRRSGGAYTVPVMVRVTPEVFLAPVLFGSRTNWLRNVQAADGCIIRWRGVDHRVVGPELIGPADARPYFGRLSWFISEKIVAPDLFVLLHRCGTP